MARVRGRRDAGDHRGQRGVGQRRIEVARPLRARVRGQWAELGVGDGRVVAKEDLGVASLRSPGLEPSNCSLRGASDPPSGARAAAARTGSRRARQASSSSGDRNGFGRGDRERVARAPAGRLEVGKERVRRRGRGGAAARSRRGARLQPGEPRGLRAPVGVLPVIAAIDGRSLGRRTAGRAGRSRRR